MLCHEYKCIFVHIPKTAGQSVEHIFLKLMGLRWENRSLLLLRENDDSSIGPPRLAHLKASEYLTGRHVTEEQFKSYFKFAFIRNPWDRIVSAYRFRGHKYRCDFKTFLFKHFPESGWTGAYTQVIPQYEFLFDSQEQLLVDYIGRFETLQEDFYQVCCMLGIKKLQLPHITRTSQNDVPRHYSEYYDDESREFIAQFYKKDILVFNYAFDNI